MVRSLEDQVAYLRQQLATRDEELRRKDHLLAAALERIPAIEAPSEPRQGRGRAYRSAPSPTRPGRTHSRARGGAGGSDSSDALDLVRLPPLLKQLLERGGREGAKDGALAATDRSDYGFEPTARRSVAFSAEHGLHQ